MEPRLRPSAEGFRRSRGENGFTLVELLVVLVILGLLATVAGPQVIKHLGGAKQSTAKLQIESLVANLDLFRLDTGRYPAEEEGLRALIDPPPGVENWNGPYVRKHESLIDPWRQPYVYRSPGRHGDFDLFSLGADKSEGGEGESRDVTNW